MSGRKLWLRYGENHSDQIVVFEPLFEELNRTRRLLAMLGRALDSAGFGLTFAALSGTGESLIDVQNVRLLDWREDAAAVIAYIKPIVIVSLRGGSILDDCGPAKGWWRFAPESGARIVRDLRRTQRTGESDLYAGNRLSEAFLADLEGAAPAPISPLRTVRLESDAAEADAKLPGTPLWRRAEPGEDAELAAAMAADLIQWVRQCAAS